MLISSKVSKVLVLVTLALGVRLAAAPSTNEPADRVARWQEDIGVYAKELPMRHVNFSTLIRRQDFDAAVAELKDNVPQLSDAELVFGLMRITARLGVAHTAIAFGSAGRPGGLHFYPIDFQWFSDGLAVIAAPVEYREAIGCRVVRMGSKTPTDAEAAVAPYISHENAAFLHVESPRYFTIAELMRQTGIADSDGRMQLTLARTNGQEFTIELRLGGGKSGRRLQAADELSIPTPLSRKHPGTAYWYEYLPDQRALFIQYNRCADDKNAPFAAFTQSLLAFADAHPVDRIIMDLRFNAGGSSTIIRPLESGLRARPALTAPGKVYVLIAGRTFSSGVFAVMEFRRDLHATLVGEPTGNKPNHYGYQQWFLLPNSKLRVDYSIRHWILMPGADPDAVMPDVAAPYSLQDFLAGRDPAFEAALNARR